jgi:hypothetical protein
VASPGPFGCAVTVLILKVLIAEGRCMAPADPAPAKKRQAINRKKKEQLSL